MHRHPTDKYELEPKYKPSREQMDRYNKNVRQKYQENPEFRERTLQRNRRWKANLMEEHIEKGLKNRKEYFTEYNTAYYRAVQLVDFVNRSEEEKRRDRVLQRQRLKKRLHYKAVKELKANPVAYLRIPDSPDDHPEYPASRSHRQANSDYNRK
jgi:hypothetical protein